MPVVGPTSAGGNEAGRRRPRHPEPALGLTPPCEPCEPCEGLWACFLHSGAAPPREGPSAGPDRAETSPSSVGCRGRGQPGAEPEEDHAVLGITCTGEAPVPSAGWGSRPLLLTQQLQGNVGVQESEVCPLPSQVSGPQAAPSNREGSTLSPGAPRPRFSLGPGLRGPRAACRCWRRGLPQHHRGLCPSQNSTWDWAPLARGSTCRDFQPPPIPVLHPIREPQPPHTRTSCLLLSRLTVGVLPTTRPPTTGSTHVDSSRFSTAARWHDSLDPQSTAPSAGQGPTP